MPTVWRITTERFTDSALRGEGARLYGGRWNPKGWAMVYAAESQALALLEVMAQDAPLLARYVLIPLRVPEDLALTRIEVGQLPADWREIGARGALQALGREWLDAGRTAALNVPSAILPAERNWLFNPRHADFTRLAIGEPQALHTDARLLRRLGETR